MSQLKPTLGFRTAVSLVAGGIIGSGIFMKPALMASQLGSPALLLGTWLVAGLISLVGALANAEVAAMLPETGGQYVFFRKMFGNAFAFLYGWSAFVVFNTAGVASIAYVFGTYADYFLHLPVLPEALVKSFGLPLPWIGTLYPLENLGVKSITMVLILGLTYVNFRSTQTGGFVQVVFTVLKLGAMGLLVGTLFFSPVGSLENLVLDSSAGVPQNWLLVAGTMAALSGAFWGYDGWNNLTFVAGELKHPEKDIPASLVTGLLICIVTYLAITISYLFVLGIDGMAGAPMVATAAAEAAFGVTGGILIALMVMISTFGTTNGNVLATARVTFAMAEDRQLFPFLGKVHPRYKTPGNALWAHGIWTCVLVMSGSFDMLTDMLVFVSWLFYGFGVVGLFVLRKKLPDMPRPYRMWGYPWLPVLFLIFCLVFVGATLWNDIRLFADGKSPLINSVFGLVLTLGGIPVYYLFRHRFQG